MYTPLTKITGIFYLYHDNQIFNEFSNGDFSTTYVTIHGKIFLLKNDITKL
jgi:hypothetical protein